LLDNCKHIEDSMYLRDTRLLKTVLYREDHYREKCINARQGNAVNVSLEFRERASLWGRPIIKSRKFTRYICNAAQTGRSHPVRSAPPRFARSRMAYIRYTRMHVKGEYRGFGQRGSGRRAGSATVSWIGVSTRRAVRLFEKEGPPLFTIFGKLSLIW